MLPSHGHWRCYWGSYRRSRPAGLRKTHRGPEPLHFCWSSSARRRSISTALCRSSCGERSLSVRKDVGSFSRITCSIKAASSEASYLHTLGMARYTKEKHRHVQSAVSYLDFRCLAGAEHFAFQLGIRLFQPLCSLAAHLVPLGDACVNAPAALTRLRQLRQESKHSTPCRLRHKHVPGGHY